MPAEIDTGGHRVLHCDSRADYPTATSIHVSISVSDECRANRTSVRIDDSGPNESRRRAPKDRRRKNCVRKADRSRGSPASNRGESSPAGIPRIGDDKEATILFGGRDFPAGSRVLTQPSRRRPGGSAGGDEGENGDGLLGACRTSRASPCASEDVTKDERFSVTWNSRGNAGDETERAESPLRDETERRRPGTTADTYGSPIARHRSLRDRSWTRPRPSSSREGKTLDADPIGHLGGTRTARGNSLLSSHRSRTRAKEDTYKDSFKDGGARADVNRRTDSAGRRDRRTEDECDEIGQESTNRWRIGRSCLQLAFLLFLIAFGRYGPLGSSSVLRVNARPIANGLSVLGIGIIGAVNARSIDPIGDAGIRAERSANLSHMTGRYRGKIQMYIKNRHLQILPDGTVNGSNDDTSDYSEYAFVVRRLANEVNKRSKGKT